MAETGEKTNMVPPGTVTGFGVWQPIETAPKDGSTILCAGEFYRRPLIVFFADSCWWEACAGQAKQAAFVSGPFGATHWMPLPEGPE